jgi:uncharacterized repeat protein (TIGR01451 family)
VAGTDASPNSFAGAEAPGTEVTLDAGAYGVAETPDPGYAVSYSADCLGSIANGETKTCTITNNDKAAKLVVVKHVVNDNGGTKVAADFDIDVSGGHASPASFPGAEAPGTEVTLDAGSYDVTETEDPGYAASYSADCSGSIASGQTKTCTITNDDKAAKLVVIKHVVNDDGGTAVAGDFDITVTGGNASPGSFAGAEAPGTNVTLDAGNYNVTEAAESGYTAEYSSDCSGSIANGQTKTCTITNDDTPAKLIVIKHVVNDDGGALDAADFEMTVTGTDPTPSSFPGAEAPGTEVGISAGSYDVSETEDPGYAASYSADCSGSIANGETKTCTITNNDKPATLIVKKVVKNADGGTKTAGDFSFSVNGGSAVAFEADGENVLTVAAGSYDVTEPHVDGYATTYDNCSEVVIPNGGSATCTITNDDQPATLIVKKVVVNDEGGTKKASDFSFSVNGDDPVSFEADGQNNLTVPAGTYSVTEPAVDGYATSYAGCSEVVLANGETKTCTITNDDDIAPTVDVTKDANVASINEPGGDVIFTVTVWNTSHEAVTLTSLVDNVYGNLDKDDVGNHSWVSSLCDTGGTLAATDGTKGGADTYACTFVGSVKGDGPATHTNEVTVVVTDDEGDTATDKDTATVTIKDVPPPPPPPPAPQIDLSVTKVDTPDPATLNGQIGYTMLVTNAGPSTATGVTLADPLPAGTSYVSSSTTQGTCSFGNGLLQCSLGTIPVGGSVSVSLVVRATQAGVLTNEVTVVGKEPEPNTANNRATATTFVPTPLTPPTPKPKPQPKPKPAPAVCSTLTVGPKTLSVGKRSTIAAIVRNRGKAVKGAKVLVRGPGFAKSGRTNAGGVARITVTPLRPGITVVSVQQKLTCGTKRIGVVGVFEPPVTG